VNAPDDKVSAFALTVACPFCSAPVGEWCERPSPMRDRKARDFVHTQRVKRAGRVAIDGASLSARIEDRPGVCSCGAAFRVHRVHHVDRRTSRVVVTCPAPTTKEST
jgi:hypothetical protein